MISGQMTSRKLTWRRVAGTALLAGVVSFGAAGGVGAHAEHGHPARIHKGTCESLQGVAFRLNGVGGSVDAEGAPVATPTAVNPSTTYQVMTSDSVIDGTIDDLLASEHAVMIYESDEAMDVIACGNVGGAMKGDQLITGLAEARIPGHLGFAVFSPEGEQTSVTIMLGHAMAPMSATGADHSHDAGDDHGNEEAHDEVDHDEAEEASHATPAA